MPYFLCFAIYRYRQIKKCMLSYILSYIRESTMPTSKYHRFYKFKNGATLIYFKHNVNNTTRVTGGFISGSQKDIIPGTAHYLEHMMANIKGQEDVLRRSGIEFNAFTGASYVCLDFDIPNRNLDLGFDIFSRMTFNKNFNEQDFENERKAILQEEKLNGNRDISLTDYFNQTYREEKITGTEEDIKKIKIQDLLDYQNQNFVSENYVICVTSSLDFDTVKQKVEDSIVSKLPSDISKKNTPHKDERKLPTSYFIYKPINDLKTISLTFAIVDNMSFESINVHDYIDDFIFNDSFSGLMLKKFRTEKGIVYSAYMNNQCGLNNDVYKVFTITTSKEHVNEVIKTLAEVLELARKGMSEKEYADYISKLKTIESDRRVQQKFLDSTTILQRYIDGEKLWFNNPVHKAVKLTREQINNYLNRTFKNKPIYFQLVGDFDLNKVYTPTEIQEMTKSKCFDFIQEKDSTDTYYYSTKTGEELDSKEMEKSQEHRGSLHIVEDEGEVSIFDSLALAMLPLSIESKLAIIEKLAKLSGIDDLELILKERSKKRHLVEMFAKKLNISLDLENGTIQVLDNNNYTPNEIIQRLRNESLKKRLKLIEEYAKKQGVNLSFNISGDDSSQEEQEQSNDQEESNNQEEIQK